jgi:hypothetical protein
MMASIHDPKQEEQEFVWQALLRHVSWRSL